MPETTSNPEEQDPFMTRLMQVSTLGVVLTGSLLAYYLHGSFGLSWPRLFFMVTGMGVGLILGLLPQDGKGLTFYLVAAGGLGMLLGRLGLVMLVIGTLPMLYLGVGLRQIWLWRLYWEGKLPYRPYWQTSFKIAYRFI